MKKYLDDRFVAMSVLAWSLVFNMFSPTLLAVALVITIFTLIDAAYMRYEHTKQDFEDIIVLEYDL